VRLAAIVLVALVLAPTVAAAPPGFTRAPKLEPAASLVAKKKVTVWCPRTDAAWAAGMRKAGLPVSSHGTANLERKELWLEKVVCDNLAIALRFGVEPAGYGSFAPSLLVLVHESVHLRGLLHEGRTDCTASRELPNVAVKYFNRRAIVVPSLKRELKRWRDANDAVYRTVC
jgi:hypothetical protein